MPPLRREDELELILAARAGDAAARARLVEAYLPLIACVAADVRSGADPVPIDVDDVPLPPAEYVRMLAAIEPPALLALLGRLTTRERIVLRARHGCRPREEVAERLGVTPERVSEIERRALGKLVLAVEGARCAAGR